MMFGPRIMLTRPACRLIDDSIMHTLDKSGNFDRICAKYGVK